MGSGCILYMYELGEFHRLRQEPCLDDSTFPQYFKLRVAQFEDMIMMIMMIILTISFPPLHCFEHHELLRGTHPETYCVSTSVGHSSHGLAVLARQHVTFAPKVKLFQLERQALSRNVGANAGKR